MKELENSGKIVAGVICVVVDVEKGDVLNAIVTKYKTTIPVVCALNNIADPNKIYIGQKLYVPCATALK